MRTPAGANGVAAALTVVLAAGILTLWIPARWALAAYQTAVLLLVAGWAARIAVAPSTGIVWHSAWVVPGLVSAWAWWQVGSGTTVQAWSTRTAALDWMCWSGIAFLAAQVFVGIEPRHRFQRATLWFGAGLAILATLQMFTSEGQIFWIFPSGYTDWVLGPFVYRNQYAAFVEMVLPVVLSTGLRRSKRTPYWVVTAILVASVVAGASRAGTFLIALEVVVVMVLALRAKSISGRTFWLAGGQLAAAAAIAIAILGWTPLWKRFQQADSYTVRREMLVSSVAMFRERPVTGFGMGTWPAAYPAYALFDDGLYANQAHNDWAQWAAEGGLPALAGMIWLAIRLAGPAIRSGWGIGLLFVLAHALVDYPLQQRPQLAGWFFALAGAVAAWAVERRRTSEGGPPP